MLAITCLLAYGSLAYSSAACCLLAYHRLPSHISLVKWHFFDYLGGCCLGLEGAEFQVACDATCCSLEFLDVNLIKVSLGSAGFLSFSSGL